VLPSSHLSSLPPAVHFGLPSGLCYSQPIDCTVCNQVQVQDPLHSPPPSVLLNMQLLFPFASCRGGAAPRPVPGRLHTHHHRLRHSLLSLRAAGQLARTASRFTPHIAAIPAAATFVSMIPSAHQPQPPSHRFAAFTYATRSPASHGKVHGQPPPTLHCTVNRELSGRFFRRLHTSPSPSSPNTPSEDSSRRLPAGPQPSSSFRGAAAAGICGQLVWSAASSGLPASPTSCSRPIRPVTSITRPFAPHQPARPAASAVCRAQWMRMPAGALGRHPGSRAIRTAGLSWH